MIKAILKKTGITVYIHEGSRPNMRYNTGKLVVSKNPHSMCTFCVDESELTISNG